MCGRILAIRDCVFRRIGGLEIFLNDDHHFYEQVKKTVQAPTESSIIGSMNGLEEAKKRDKKIQITDIAIQKVREVKVPGFSEVQNANLQYAHKQLLEYALKQNNSNEVMGMTSLAFDGVLYLKPLRIKYNDDFDAIVRDFLRNCRKVGIIYVKD